jgi:hypothetical protein
VKIFKRAEPARGSRRLPLNSERVAKRFYFGKFYQDRITGADLECLV